MHLSNNHNCQKYTHYHTDFNFREVQTTQTTTVINVLANYTFRFDRTTDNTYDRTPYDNETVIIRKYRFLQMEQLQSPFLMIILSPIQLLVSVQVSMLSQSALMAAKYQGIQSRLKIYLPMLPIFLSLLL